MILDWFSFFKTRFLNQKDHVVKCLGHRHRPFLLVEKKALLFYHGLEAPGSQLPGTAALRMSVRMRSLQAKGWIFLWGCALHMEQGCSFPQSLLSTVTSLISSRVILSEVAQMEGGFPNVVFMCFQEIWNKWDGCIDSVSYWIPKYRSLGCVQAVYYLQSLYNLLSILVKWGNEKHVYSSFGLRNPSWLCISVAIPINSRREELL